MKRLYLFITIIMCSSLTYGQYDSVYVEKSKVKYAFGGYFKLRKFRADFPALDTRVDELDNLSIFAGVRVKYKQVDINVGVPFYRINGPSEPRNSTVGLTMKVYPRSSMIQLNAQYFTDVAGWQNFIPSAWEHIINDTRFVYANAFGTYALNGKKLSFRSAYSMLDRQRKSASSWLITGHTEYQRLNSDLLDAEYLPQQITRYQRFSFGVGAGYAANLIYNNWSFNGLCSANLEYTTSSYTTSRSSTVEGGISLYPRLRTMGSIVYNKDAKYYFLEVEQVYDRNNSALDETHIRSWMIKLGAGKRW